MADEDRATATAAALGALPAGAWDVHVHAAPSLFARRGDAWELAEACAAAGMAGVVLKAHHGSTAELAAVLDRRFPALAVRGGVVLNHGVGGLNPLAVEQCRALGGRVVWLPTIHAAHHGATFGALGAFGFQGRPLATTPRDGLRIADDRGALLPAVHEILALLDGGPLVLATGHAAPREIVSLQRAIERDGRDVRLLVNHALFTVPAFDAEQLRPLVRPWTYFELCYFSLSELAGEATDAATVARTIRALPAARWVLASDSGQPQNPPSPRALARFCELLAAEGITGEELTRMLCAHPRELLGEA